MLSGEGILDLEAACASLIEPGDKVLCIDNGLYGKGFGDFASMYGGEVTYFTCDYRKKIDPQKLKDFLVGNGGFKVATMVHCETPSGLTNPVDKLCTLLKEHGIITVVDSVSGIAGENLEVDQWKVDIALGGSQKCLSAPFMGENCSIDKLFITFKALDSVLSSLGIKLKVKLHEEFSRLI